MEQIGDYEYDLKGMLGYGSFAIVYKGRHRTTKSPVAIKCISKKKLGRASALLMKEINILKELPQHVNIVQLYGCETMAQSYFLAMEYCNGGNLGEYLQIKGTLREDTIRLFFRQIVNAMRIMHDRGILHRDLKPQNLLLAHKMPNPKPHDILIKVADFGFARHLQSDMMAATMCGSPLYMAPEVLAHKQYNAKADLWSVGTILYQCLVGRSPFYASTPDELGMFYEKSKKVEPKIPSGTSKNLADLLLKLLKKKASERINFYDFFHHEFFSLRSQTSPVPVPIRPRGSFATPNSSSTSDSRSLVESPQVEIECSPSVGDPLFLKSSSESDSEDFVMIPHPFSSENVNGAKSVGKSKVTATRRKYSVPTPTHKPLVSHRKQLSQGSPKRSTEDREVSRTQPKNLGRRSPFMQRTAEATVSPITIRYSGQQKRRTSSNGDMDAGLKRQTQTETSQKPVPNLAQTHHKSVEKRQFNNFRAKSLSPLYSDNLMRRLSIEKLPSSASPVSPGAVKAYGSPNDISTIPENPNVATVQGPGAYRYRNFKCVPDNNNEPYISRLTRPWTSPNLAKLYANTVKAQADGVVSQQGREKLPADKTKQDTKRGISRREETDGSPSLQSIFKTDAALGIETSPETEFRFYYRLSGIICEVAEEHVMFSCHEESFGVELDPLRQESHQQKLGERLLLHMKSLQLVATALHTLRNKVNAGVVKVTPQIRDVAKDLNERYKEYLQLCEESKALCDVTESSRINLTSADKILHCRALRDCQSAALDEMFEGNYRLCVKKYERSLVLLEGLSLATNNDADRKRLSKFKKGVRYRLETLNKNMATVPPVSEILPP